MNKLLSVFEKKDIKIAIAVGVCLLTAKLFPIIQYIPSCFAAILCMQDTIKLSWKMGLTRIIITIIGGIVGVLVIIADGMINNEWILIIMAMIGILFTLWGCKIAHVPYISAMIGCITFLLVIMVMSGNERLFYACLRLFGTIYGVIVSLIINWIIDLFQLSVKKIQKTKIELKEEDSANFNS